MNTDNLKISQHAKERYAERIMDRDTILEINTFISTHEEKIQTDIKKMIEYGQLIYTGKSDYQFNKQPVDIYLNGTWVLIVDNKKQNVITLFSIDLGLGPELNNQYVTKLLEKLEAANSHLQEVIGENAIQSTTYKSLIEENKNVINSYRSLISSLMEQNEAYEGLLKTMQTNVSIAEKDVRDVVAIFTGKKVF